MRDQEILITKGTIDDQMINMFFAGFSATVLQNFGQTIVPTKQPYNQALVLEAGIFKFVKMTTPTTYEVSNTVELTQAFRIFSQLINQDQKFLNQMQSFMSMLVDSQVFQPTSTPNPQSNQVNKRSVKPLKGVSKLQFRHKSVFSRVSTDKLNNTIGNIKNKRDISDIFSPYSVQSIGDTAAENYAKLNLNFDQIHHTEERLSHQQTVLAQTFKALNADERQVKRKELYLELRAFRTSFFQSFMFDMLDILKNNALDPVYNILFELLRKHEFCYSATCYTLPIFSALNETTIQISVQTAAQSLVPAVYVSCTIMPNLRTSIFSHQIAILDGDNLNFQAPQLPSIPLALLHDPKVDEATRQLELTDYVHQQLYLIYSGKKVSLQCITAQMIVVDGSKQYCDQTSLNFVEFPRSIQIGDQSVLQVAIPHHFSSKLDFLNSDMRSISIFHNSDYKDPHFGNKVINFFQKASAIHYSFTFIAFLCVLLMFLLCCCSCYLKCPSCLLYAFSCYSNTCCIRQRILNRQEHEKELAKKECETEMQPMLAQGADQSVPQNPPPVPQNPQPAPQNPQAPPIIRPQQPPYNPNPYTKWANCKNNIVTCSCLVTGFPCPHDIVFVR